MSGLRRLFACLVLTAVVLPGAALAARADSVQAKDPQDEARAEAMLLRKSDFLPGFVPKRSSGSGDLGGGKLECPGLETEHIDPTGNANSPRFQNGPVFVISQASVFGTLADANAVWRDFTSSAGRECFTKIVRRAFEAAGTKLVSVRRVPFPRVAQRTQAFRIVVKVKTVPVYLDWVMLKHSRAAAMLMTGGALVPLQRADLLSFARIIAGRMATAMRGT